MEDLTGKQLGPYRVVGPLGSGGMAAVYKAYQPSMDRYVALKILPRHFANDPQFVGRFSQEAKVLAKLQHPHILPVFDFGDAEGYTYLVMPFVETGTLTGLLQGEPLPLARIRTIVAQVCSALGYAHGRGLVHRDVKPSNVLIDETGNCLLTDFGIAKIIEGTTKFTSTGGIIGTPAYMSPEQGQGGKVDARTDVYALGVMLYEMATGRVPFDAETPIAVIFKHIHDPLPPPRQLNPALPESLERVILKALAKDPADRYQTAQEMGQAWAEAAGAPPTAPAKAIVEPSPAAAPTVPSPPPDVTPGPRAAVEPRRRGLALGVIALAALALGAVVTVAVVAVLLLRPAASPPPAETATGEPAVVTSPPTASPSAPTPAPRPPADPLGVITIRPGEPIRVAAALVLSGPASRVGEDSLRGVELAIDDRGGELLGRPIELVGEDSGCSPDGGLAVARKLAAEQGIVAVIGTSCSSAAMEAAPILSEAGLTMISPSNTLPALTDPAQHAAGYLRTAHNDQVQGAMAAEFAYHQLGIRRAATIQDGSPYSRALQREFAELFAHLGGTIVAQETIQPGQAELRPLLIRIAEARPELLYYPLPFETGAPITAMSREVAGLKAVARMSTDALFLPELLDAVGEAAIGTWLSAPDPAGWGPAYEAFVVRYREKYGHMPTGGFHGQAYDAANMIFAAVEKVAIREPDGTVHIGRQALREALFGTRDFPGLTGRLTCNPTGDCGAPLLAIFEVRSADPRAWRPGTEQDSNPVRVWP